MSRPRATLARALLAAGAALLYSLAAHTQTAADAAASAAPVLPGYTLQFPADFGSHPQFGIEWWYVTGWLDTAQHEQLGFQITFFRARSRLDEPNPSAFAPQQLLIAHCAISDPRRGRLWQDQRIRRTGFGLAEARSGDTDVWIDDWKLERHGEAYSAKIMADGFLLDLTLATTQPPMLNGVAGFSQKGTALRAASYYYSQPQLRVSGAIARAERRDQVRGVAWLDHEWSSEYLQHDAVGWDWIGINLDDGGALMAFQIRGQDGQALWAGGSLRDAQGHLQTYAPDQIRFVAQRRWRSPRSGVTYPVTWRVTLAGRSFELAPLLDDQENDTRQSSGAIYWEGAVRVRQADHAVGRGYLELTGYERPLSLR